ncbi:MAG: hypothetical protein H7A05_06895 [Pseudomonadales bacterium]|nr:hypothetical protein [Pseudomonadales bacterium]
MFQELIKIMIVLRILFLMCLVGTSYGQVQGQLEIDLSSVAAESLPEIGEFDLSQGNASGESSEFDSPYNTSRIMVWEEPSPGNVGSDLYTLRASVISNATPLMNFRIQQYKRVEIEWLDNENFQIASWPDDCVELITVYSVSKKRVVYQAGFQHCD